MSSSTSNSNFDQQFADTKASVDSGRSTTIKLAIAIPIVIVVLLIISGIVFWIIISRSRRRRREQLKSNEQLGDAYRAANQGSDPEAFVGTTYGVTSYQGANGNYGEAGTGTNMAQVPREMPGQAVQEVSGENVKREVYSKEVQKPVEIQ